MKRRTLVGALAALPGFTWSQATRMAGGKAATRGWPARLVLGLITPRDPEQMLKAWTPFADRLGKSLGVPVECRMYKVTAELVEDFRRGLVDFAFVGNLPALELVESGNAAVFAQLVVKGQHAFRSLLVTHKDSPIRGIADVSSGSRRWVFGDGDVKSTSGHVVPRYYAFIKRGINEPEGLFREVRRGSHLENMMRAAAKEVDVATTNTTELSLLREARPEVANELRVVWESPDIPESPLVWSTALPASLRQKMQDFTIAFGQRDAREKEILTGINNLTGFRKSNNAQLTMIADMEMFNARQRIMNDGKLSAEERSAKVEEVIRRGTKLELQLKLGRPA